MVRQTFKNPIDYSHISKRIKNEKSIFSNASSCLYWLFK